MTRPGTKVEPKRYWRSYLEDQYERRIKPLFKSLSDQALSRTKTAVKAEQKLVGDGRGAGAPPRPTDGELESAQNAQRAHMEQIIEQHLKNSDFT